jgi:hypothetical protein
MAMTALAAFGLVVFLGFLTGAAIAFAVSLGYGELPEAGLDDQDAVVEEPSPTTSRRWRDLREAEAADADARFRAELERDEETRANRNHRPRKDNR